MLEFNSAASKQNISDQFVWELQLLLRCEKYFWQIILFSFSPPQSTSLFHCACIITNLKLPPLYSIYRSYSQLNKVASSEQIKKWNTTFLVLKKLALYSSSCCTQKILFLKHRHGTNNINEINRHLVFSGLNKDD